MKCKLCGSARVGKYGMRPGGQRYICRECGQTFTDNQALPGMKTKKVIVDRFIELRNQSKPLSQIVDIILAEYKVRLSVSVLSRWDRKFSTKPVKDKHWRRPLTDLKEIVLKNKGKTMSDVDVRKTFGYSQFTKIEDTQLASAGIIERTCKQWLIKS